jgi:hypothetical protein
MMSRALTVLGLSACLLAAGAAMAAAPRWVGGDGDFGPYLTYDDPHGPQIGDGLDCNTHPAENGQTAPNTNAGLVHFAWSFAHNAHARRGADGVARDVHGRPEPWPTTLTLSSQSVSAAFPATATDDHDTDPPGFGVYVEADVPARGPVMQAFARTGYLTLAAYGLVQRPVKATTAAAAHFISLCSK